MKTIHQIRKEIDSILSLDRSDMKKREHNRHSKRVILLNSCLMYLETKPDEEFINKEIARLTKRIDAITAGQPNFEGMAIRNIPAEKELIKSYLKEYKVPELSEQLKTLNYLLS